MHDCLVWMFDCMQTKVRGTSAIRKTPLRRVYYVCDQGYSAATYNRQQGPEKHEQRYRLAHALLFEKGKRISLHLENIMLVSSILQYAYIAFFLAHFAHPTSGRREHAIRFHYGASFGFSTCVPTLKGRPVLSEIWADQLDAPRE